MKDGCLDADLMKQTVHKAGMAGSSRTNSTACHVNENQCLENKTIRLQVHILRFFLFFIDWIGAREGRMTANRGRNARFSTGLGKAR